jgi:hypothetical protein
VEASRFRHSLWCGRGVSLAVGNAGAAASLFSVFLIYSLLALRDFRHGGRGASATEAIWTRRGAVAADGPHTHEWMAQRVTSGH